VAAWLVVRWRDAVTERAPAFAMAIVVVLLFFAVARSRTDVAYRYAYLAWLLFLPALGLALHDLGRRPVRRCVLAIAVSVVLGLLGLARLVDVVHGQNEQRGFLKRELTEMARRTRTDGFVPEVIVDNERAPLLRAKQVAEWARAGKFPAPSRAPSPGELRTITARTLFIWGDRDPVGSTDVARSATELMPNARLEILPAGHVPQLGHPERVADILSTFLGPSGEA